MASPSQRARLGLAPTRYEFALLYCAAIWGSTFYIVRDTLADVHPLSLIGWRFTTAGLVLLPFAIFARRGGVPSPPRGGGWAPPLLNSYGLLLGVIIFILYAAQTYGLVYTTAANSAFITGLFVIFVPPFAYLMHREVPGGMRVLAVLIAIAGLYLLTGGIAGLNRGDLLTLIAAATYALQVLILGRAMAAGHDALMLTCQQMLVCGVLSFGTALVIHAPLGLGTPRAAGMVLFLTLLPTLSAYLLQSLCQRHVDALRTALIFTMEPVFGALFAWTLGAEAFVPMRAVGGLLIVVAMFVSEVSASKTTA